MAVSAYIAPTPPLPLTAIAEFATCTNGPTCPWGRHGQNKVIMQTPRTLGTDVPPRKRAGQPNSLGSITALFTETSKSLWVYTVSYSVDTNGGSFCGVKRPGHEFQHSPPSSAEITNEWR